MRNWQNERKIKYEAELDKRFQKEIAKEAWGEHLLGCIQCGTCSGTCPVSHYMDYTPRRIIAMTRAGFKQDILNCFTIWLCASCYECTVECPKEIKITDVMYALKQRAIADGVYPKGFPTPVLAREFYRMVQTHGRSSELWLMMNVMMKTNPMDAMKSSRLGLKLMRQGRLSFKTESIPMGHGKKGDLKTILDYVDKQTLN